MSGITLPADRLRGMMDARNISVMGILKKLRGEGLTISESYIYTILQGKNKTPSPSTCWLLTHALGYPIEQMAPYLDPKGVQYVQPRKTGARIAEYQARTNLRQSSMALKLGIDVPTYNALVAGNIRDLTRLRAFLDKLGIDAQEGGFGAIGESPAKQDEPEDEEISAPAPAPQSMEIEVVEFVNPPTPPPAPAVLPPPVSIEPVAQPVPAPGVPAYLEAAQWMLQSVRATEAFLRTHGGIKQLQNGGDDVERNMLGNLSVALSGLFRTRAGSKAGLLMDALEIALDPQYNLDAHGSTVVRALLALKSMGKPPSPVEVSLLTALTQALQLREGLVPQGGGEGENSHEDEDDALDGS